MTYSQQLHDQRCSHHSLYEQLKAAGCEIGSHYSDLYVKATPDSSRIIAEYRKSSKIGAVANVTVFKNQISGEPWYDISFHYDPFWAAKGMLGKPGDPPCVAGEGL
jgi:hypothetical protein